MGNDASEVLKHVATVSILVGMAKASPRGMDTDLERDISRLMNFFYELVAVPVSISDPDRDDEFFSNNVPNDEDDSLWEEDDDEEVSAVEFDEDVHIDDLAELTMLKCRVISSSMGNPDDDAVVSFNSTGRFTVTNLVDDATRDVDVNWVLRTGKTLKVGSGPSAEFEPVMWHEFSISKFPKDWTSLLRHGLMYRVVVD